MDDAIGRARNLRKHQTDAEKKLGGICETASLMDINSEGSTRFVPISSISSVRNRGLLLKLMVDSIQRKQTRSARNFFSQRDLKSSASGIMKYSVMLKEFSI